tara:strand:- start:1528 stop:1947 length:420 start_codon:yes stop_codon:yes gene_type:complete
MLTNKNLKTTLIIYGPNLNLISIKFLKGKNKNITIDKINNQIRKTVNKNNNRVKIIQTNEEGKAINFIQKHRKKTDGIILYPGIWQSNGYGLKELLHILQTPFITISSGEKIKLLSGIKNFPGQEIIKETKEALNLLCK